MKLYGAIDLHSINNVTVVINEQDQVVYQKRLPNDLSLIAQQLSTYRRSLKGIVVESTYNWYWLVDGLMEKGYRLHLANTAAIPMTTVTRDGWPICCGWGSYPRDTFIPSKRERYVICCASGASSCIRGRQTFSVSRV
jgi:hypothetical protein